MGLWNKERVKKLEIYKDRKQQWRWRLVSSNGRIMADSAESYTRKDDAMRAAHRFRKAAGSATIVYDEQITLGKGDKRHARG